jgi:hypothetical protein
MYMYYATPLLGNVHGLIACGYVSAVVRKVPMALARYSTSLNSLDSLKKGPDALIKSFISLITSIININIAVIIWAVYITDRVAFSVANVHHRALATLAAFARIVSNICCNVETRKFTNTRSVVNLDRRRRIDSGIFTSFVTPTRSIANHYVISVCTSIMTVAGNAPNLSCDVLASSVAITRIRTNDPIGFKTGSCAATSTRVLSNDQDCILARTRISNAGSLPDFSLKPDASSDTNTSVVFNLCAFYESSTSIEPNARTVAYLVVAFGTLASFFAETSIITHLAHTFETGVKGKARVISNTTHKVTASKGTNTRVILNITRNIETCFIPVTRAVANMPIEPRTRSLLAVREARP